MAKWHNFSTNAMIRTICKCMYNFTLYMNYNSCFWISLLHNFNEKSSFLKFVLYFSMKTHKMFSSFFLTHGNFKLCTSWTTKGLDSNIVSQQNSCTSLQAQSSNTVRSVMLHAGNLYLTCRQDVECWTHTQCAHKCSVWSCIFNGSALI